MPQFLEVIDQHERSTLLPIPFRTVQPPPTVPYLEPKNSHPKEWEPAIVLDIGEDSSVQIRVNILWGYMYTRVTVRVKHLLKDSGYV
ncbi:hypothetical protein CDAR_529891 [Caerostris darwini]|uniref:Uncharacterized protein n=1 Tax=Caerostris darwini TaxID=1538125 RepID=A0AAV4SGE0_9ARAC|nr:hypothetical protein CDAR_529891 [Caerostris darwini]